MKTQREIVSELRSVRTALASIRDEGSNTLMFGDMMYGAQQALVWMLDEGRSPSSLQCLIDELSETLDDQ